MSIGQVPRLAYSTVSAPQGSSGIIVSAFPIAFHDDSFIAFHDNDIIAFHDTYYGERANVGIQHVPRTEYTTE